jgi:hypothetical protein
MSIFRQILQVLMLILAELRKIHAEADEIEQGIEELIKDQEAQPASLKLIFGAPKHK